MDIAIFNISNDGFVGIHYKYLNTWQKHYVDVGFKAGVLTARKAIKVAQWC